METIEQLITASPVFAGMEPSQLALIAGCARNQHVEPERTVLREGGRAETFYLIRRGAVALEIHAPGRAPLVIETLHDRDVLGWSWLFAPYRWQLDARSVEPCELIAFDAECLRGKCEADHELGYQLMRRFTADLVEKLQATRLQLIDVYGHAGQPA